MKKVGIIIMAIGLAITLITGFSYVTREKVVDLGEIQVSKNKNHNVAWSPIAGIVVMVVGGGIFLFGLKKQ
ncbi:hypothetical protein [Williamwhitmania taraxaci]|uniref:Uncharacterized protein n=1 Tax=Williamwhitmania taraxaci TaxID=1640674 RepID=A0A1G6PV44_9BACT|nr:hypothetical protein [Williamwhitmania taraxaci]SDC83396.1 hypothetical protein SAMN05216323_10551 [Williamwhitmania taraxaci]